VPSLRTRVMNAMPTLLLRSPAHPLLSGKYLILSFTGRRTGRRYRTPVAYVRQGSRLIISTDSPWSVNVNDGRPVTVLLRGRSHQGLAQRIDGGAAAASGLRQLVDQIPGYASAADLSRTGRTVADAEIHRAVAGPRTVIAIDLTDHDTTP
jgi:deazaflavin-dependent oxidoreductase (nitroreductase family)